MILQVRFRPIVALTCAFVFTGAVYLWMPQLNTFGKDTEIWLEQRSSNFQELQTINEALLETEYSYKSYIITGDERWHEQFKKAVAKIYHELSILRSMNASETRNLDKLRAIQNQLTGVLEELKDEAKLRPSQSSDQAKQLLESTKQIDTIKEIQKDVSLMQRAEYDLLRQNVLIYNNLVKSGPYPWLAILLIFGVSGLVAFSNSPKTSEEEIKETDEELQKLNAELADTKSQLERMTNLDTLTEVLNMQGLQKELSIEENRMVRAGGHLISILVNCDNFAKLNDEIGHTMGDKVLKDCVKRIVGTLRPSDHVARVGGDEFLVLLPDTQLAYGMRVAERIRVAVNDTPLHNAKNTKMLTVSIGVATIPGTILTVEEVVSQAKSALKRSKDGGKNKVSLAKDASGVESSTTEQKSLVAKLTDESSFRVVFQPIVDLGSDEVAGFEIFTRGLEGSFESPDEFFKLCIENNVLTTVDMNCLKLCIEQSKSIAEEMRVHLNVFPSTIVDTSIEEFINMFPTASGHKFCIELSEQHFIIEPKHMRDSINAIREAGIMVAIDDIGFGRSSLESLILLEPDVVKVDRKYVTGVSDDVGKVRLLRRLTNVAKSLGAEVVAEGIERRDDIPILQDLGVHFGQGFVWGELMEVLPEDADEQRSLYRTS